MMQLRSGRVFALALVLLSALVTLPAAASDVDPAGHWEGAIEIPGSPLTIIVDLARDQGGAWSGAVSIPQQGASNLSAGGIAVDGASVSFALSGIPGEPKFSGTLSEDGDHIEGQFTQGGASFPFNLERATAPAADADASVAALEPVIEQALKDFKVPGLGLAVVVDGKVVTARGYGLRDMERSLPVDEHTLFAIGSATKAFTSCLLATLVDEGKLEWDTPVADLIPGFRLEDDHATLHLTVRDMLSHASGLPRHDLSWYGVTDATRADLVHSLRYLQPFRDLRQQWHYQNLMYVTAGYLGGQLTGSSWEEAVRQRLLVPLGMDETNFSVADSERAVDHAVPYREDDHQLEAIPFRAIGPSGPAGAINSSAADMARWLRLQLGDGSLDGRRIVSEVALKEMHTPQMVLRRYPDKPDTLVLTYGLGWFIDAYRGHYEVQHGGNIDGFSALVTLYPLDGVGVVAMVNAEHSPLPGLVTRTLADRLLDLTPKPWLSEALERRKKGEEAADEAEKKKESVRVEGTSPAHPLADYAGEYAHPAYGTLSVELVDGGLVATLHGIRTPLEHWHYETFNGLKNPDDPTFEDMKFTFRTNPAGQVDAVTAPLEPEADDIVFARLPDQRLKDPEYLQRFTGDYEIAGDTLTVALQGDALLITVPGQPPYELEPRQGAEFGLKGVSVVTVRFVLDDAGQAKEVQLIQPNGVFTAERKSDEVTK